MKKNLLIFEISLFVLVLFQCIWIISSTKLGLEFYVVASWTMYVFSAFFLFWFGVWLQYCVIRILIMADLKKKDSKEDVENNKKENCFKGSVKKLTKDVDLIN